jgi:hypothetical protein
MCEKLWTLPWVARSARAAMWALGKSGVPFRTIVYEDGTIERSQQPNLPAWEVPTRWEPEAAAQSSRAAAAGAGLL